MIKENQRFLNKIQIFSDAIIIVISMVLAYYVRFDIFNGIRNNITLSYYIQLSLFIIPIYLFLYSVNSLYLPHRGKSYAFEFINIAKANIMGMILLISALFLIKEINVSRWALIIFCLSNMLLLCAKRFILRKSLKIIREKEFNLKHVIILGSGELAKKYLQKIRDNRSLGFADIGYIADDKNLKNSKHLGYLNEMSNIIETIRPDEVVAALSYQDYDKMVAIIEACEKSGTKLSIVPFYTKYIPARPYIDEIDELPLINIRHVPLDNIGNAIFKRMMDIVGSIILIIVTSPLMLFTSIAIKISSPGPVIFKQKRMGLNKKLFTMYKFRSMSETKQTAATAWSKNEDPRRTRLGAIIRKFSIDEIPQFFNVLKGEMSLVGPRPEIPHFVNKFRDSVPRYMVKHQVRPGITGWAQVNGFRGDTSIEGRIEYDLYYIENWTPLFDFKILFMTLAKGIVNQEKLISRKKRLHVFQNDSAIDPKTKVHNIN